MATAEPVAPGLPAIELWQRRLLPFMMLILVVGSVFFAVISVVQVRALDAQLATAPARMPTRPKTLPASEVSYAFDVTVALEQEVTERRYQLALGMVRVRLWTRMMGFSAGMVLAMVGAAFVLGRLQESAASQMTARGGGIDLALTTASPGLALAFLGTLLMGISIVVSPSVTTTDGAVYVPAVEGEVVTHSATDTQLHPVQPPPPKNLP